MSQPKKIETVHVETLDGELCIYDWQRLEVHSLNSTAAQVWEMCDGLTRPQEMALHLNRDLTPTQAEALVWLTLKRLEQAKLLETGTVNPAGSPREVYTRRHLLARLGVAAVMLPVVSSIVAPEPAAAQSAQQPPPQPGPPTARDDSLAVSNGSSASDNVLANDDDGNAPPIQVISFGDSEANVGTFPADGVTVGSFPAPGGGTIDVTLDANGALSVIANGTTGTGTVTIFYQIQNSVDADIGQVDITFGDFPTAQDDTQANGITYQTNVGVTLNIGAGTGLLNNDTLGTPAATLTAWGGGDASPNVNRDPGTSRPFAGGTLTINANGSFDLVNPTTPGVYTFEYVLENAIGSSQATVEITIA